MATHPRSISRRLKRILISLCEIGVFVLGNIISLLIVYLADLHRNGLDDAILIFGMIVSFIIVLWIRSKTYAWKFAYSVECCMVERAERLQNPSRWKRLKLVRRFSIWVLSAIAMLVLFFFPVVTHVLYPRAGHLQNYRVSLPWYWFVMPWNDGQKNRYLVDAFIYSGGESGFGLAPLKPIIGGASFGEIDVETMEFLHQYIEAGVSGRKGLVRRELLTGGTRIGCWEYPAPADNGCDNGTWIVECITPIEVKERPFHAGYFGPKGALPVFYAVILNMKPVH